LPDGLASGQYAVLTLHRPSNVDEPRSLSAILGAVIDISRRIPIVFPAHPRTVKNLREFGMEQGMHDRGTIRIVEPMSYLPFLGLVAHSRMVLTDSGGIQEETTTLGIPCLTLRTNTERPITCECGTNILVGTDPVAIRKAAFTVLDGQLRPVAIPERWDGRAAERIVSVFLNGHNQ
jgi:UDP-N-acetylglucosamine 2-epimerase (non-hydrolysing)